MLILNKLQKLANNNCLPHALLLNSKSKLAFYIGNVFSKWLLCVNSLKRHNNNINNDFTFDIHQCKCTSCSLFSVNNHPDYYIINLGILEEIKIDHIRSANEFIISNFYLSETKILLINNFHNISMQAANAFLKNLEEPSLNFKILILLITSNPKVLPNTILSRVVKINLFNLIEEFDKDIQKDEFESTLLQDLYKVWISMQLTPNQLVVKWQRLNKSKLTYSLWNIIINLIKFQGQSTLLDQSPVLDLQQEMSSNQQPVLDLQQQISPNTLWLLLDSLNYFNKTTILNTPINWELFLYNFIITKFSGENAYVNCTRRL